ncbi:hypothetical protein [Sphingomonas echinoides]|uniref:hypothetical protein n=1 Tax=Sphingomonas echinoides TaxID=59803 RepID=UPI0024132CCE|nr:hypothetical protein [Sphingomonas echinoides]
MGIIAAVVSPSTQMEWGAPFPSATVVSGPEHTKTVDAATHVQECFLRYRFKSNASLSAIADFYLHEGKANKAVLFDDSKSKIAEYRTLTFTKQKFMFVTLSQETGYVLGAVVFQVRSGCSQP